MVTHDQEEALTMADRLVVMSEGAVRQIGTQRDLYERPTDSFVAGFVGRSSFIQGEIDPANGFRSEGGLQIRCDRRASGPAVLALRPERVTVAMEPLNMDNSFTGKVEFVSYLGGLIDIHTRLSALDRVIAQVPNSANPRPRGRRSGPCGLGGVGRVPVPGRRHEARTRARGIISKRRPIMKKLAPAAATTRRRLMQGAAGFAGLAWMPSLAFAQAKGQIVVGTWGGDYARLLRKNIEDPILIPAGWEVIQDQAGDPERRARWPPSAGCHAAPPTCRGSARSICSRCTSRA